MLSLIHVVHNVPSEIPPCPIQITSQESTEMLILGIDIESTKMPDSLLAVLFRNPAMSVNKELGGGWWQEDESQILSKLMGNELAY